MKTGSKPTSRVQNELLEEREREIGLLSESEVSAHSFLCVRIRLYVFSCLCVRETKKEKENGQKWRKADRCIYRQLYRPRRG